MTSGQRVAAVWDEGVEQSILCIAGFAPAPLSGMELATQHALTAEEVERYDRDGYVATSRPLLTPAQLEALRNSSGTERPSVLRKELQVLMDDLVGVVRTAEGLTQAIATIENLQTRFRNIRVDDKGMKWNTDLMETWELGCLLDLAEVTAHAALWRRESRGGHFREDFPNRDDASFLSHSFVWKTDKIEVKDKPVTITRIQPQERKY